MLHRGIRSGAWTALALALLLIAPVTGHAQRSERGGPGSLVERHAERLGFDAETLGRIQEIVRSSGKRQEQLRDEIDRARGDMRSLLRQPTPPADQVLAQAEVMGALEIEADKNRLEAILRIRSLLTPEQREELIKILAEERGDGSRGRGPMRRCGSDLRALCPQAAAGLDTIRCLEAKWDRLSERCKSAFDPNDRDREGRDRRRD